MGMDYKKNNVKRTKHFKRKNPVTVKSFVPALKMLFKVSVICTAIAVAVFLGIKAQKSLNSSEYFYIKQMVFKGCGKAKEEELYKLADIDDRTNLLALDLNDVVVKILRHPWIKNVNIKKQYPDKLFIGIEEREPVAMVNLDNLYYVDIDGEIFKKLEQDDSRDFIVISGLSAQKAFSNNAEDKKLVNRAISLIKMLKQRKSFTDNDVSEILLDERLGITLFTYNSAIPVRVGFQFQNDRFDRLTRVLGELDKSEKVPEYIDIDYNQKVVVKVAANN